jgi:hypothetical protein
MQTDPAIKAALEESAWANCMAIDGRYRCDRPQACAGCAKEAAAAVAAFLRALPDVIKSVPFPTNSDGMLHTHKSYFAGDLAAAVARAAQEARDADSAS